LSISREQVRYVARLSRIALTDEEEDKFTHQLGDILAYIEKLNECDVENVQPISQAAACDNVFREDEPAESLPQSEALANGPATAKGYFKVPRIIE